MCGICGVSMSYILVCVKSLGEGEDQGYGSGIKSSHYRSGRMIQRVKVLAVKSDDPNPQDLHGRENRFPQIVL